LGVPRRPGKGSRKKNLLLFLFCRRHRIVRAIDAGDRDRAKRYPRAHSLASKPGERVDHG